MLEYKIASANSPADLIIEVNNLIKDGWEPIGGVAITVVQLPSPGIPGSTFSHQAMIKQIKERKHVDYVVNDPE